MALVPFLIRNVSRTENIAHRLWEGEGGKASQSAVSSGWQGHFEDCCCYATFLLFVLGYKYIW